jgi:DNA-binding SARP family transcriptional activator
MKGKLGLKFFLFGRPCFTIGKVELNRFDSSRALELFCYLLLNRTQPHSRELLSDLFWDDCPADRSKKNLRQILWQLQSTLRQESPEENNILEINGNWVEINEQADFWLDVSVFENTYTLFRGVDGQALLPQNFEDIREAVNLYQGNLMEGCYKDWCLFERERLQNIYFEMLEKLIDYCIVHQDYYTGIDFGNRILRYDHARERTHRRMMKLYYLAGNRTDALRQYECCAVIIKDELGVSVSQQTKNLFKQIQAETLNSVLSTKDLSLNTPESLSTPYEDYLVCLNSIISSLINVQTQIQEEIRAIEWRIGRNQ